MKTEFYIVNDFDAPDERHVVVYLPDIDKGSYNMFRYGVEGNYNFTDFSRATKLEDFGITIREVPNGFICMQDRPSIAKYRDGLPRQWQGSQEFIVS